ncbi:hypothetical protein DFP72DRAFT_311876 [Ephemerocybe angulata]|nr:hypothetical protein DFP72DRAFT_311876 [Tulosesus angulatus]
MCMKVIITIPNTHEAHEPQKTHCQSRTNRRPMQYKRPELVPKQGYADSRTPRRSLPEVNQAHHTLPTIRARCTRKRLYDYARIKPRMRVHACSYDINHRTPKKRVLSSRTNKMQNETQREIPTTDRRRIEHQQTTDRASDRQLRPPDDWIIEQTYPHQYRPSNTPTAPTRVYSMGGQLAGRKGTDEEIRKGGRRDRREGKKER